MGEGGAVVALEKIQALLPVTDHVQGTEHPDVLAARHLEALLLLEVGDAVGALEKVRSLLPIREREQGPEHPFVLALRWLRAKILAELGRVKEALAEWREILPLQEANRLSTNREVRATWEMIAKYSGESSPDN